MKKQLSLLALALSAAGLAHAQSNVTVYGVADSYIGHATASGKVNQNVVNSGGLSGSRLGFKGTEDLGNGLKALFTLEYSLSVDDNTGVGTGSSAARQQYVGLNGGFGTLLVGRLQTAGYDWTGRVNAFAGTAIDPMITVERNLGNGKTRGKLGIGSFFNGSSRASNAIAYVTPTFSGFSAAVNHARISESAATNPGSKDDYANLVSGTYANGPLTLSLIYANAKFDGSAGNTAGNISKMTEWGFGGSYDFGVAKVFGSYQKQSVDVVGASYPSDKVLQLSASVPVTAAGSVLVGYAGNTVKSTAAADNSKSYTVAYLHSLSKRTTAYAGYQYVSNDSAAALGAANTLIAPTAGGHGSILVTGLRHSF